MIATLNKKIDPRELTPLDVFEYSRVEYTVKKIAENQQSKTLTVWTTSGRCFHFTRFSPMVALVF